MRVPTPPTPTLPQPMKANLYTWRVRGVPRDFEKRDLEAALRAHPSLQCPNNSDPPEARDNGAKVHTLAIDLRPRNQVATVRFRQVPPQLETSCGQMTVAIPIVARSNDHAKQQATTGHRRESETTECYWLTLDDHFDGLTVLYSNPLEKNQLDVLALSGLGSHPWGSFADKEYGNMWLSDSLPSDLPSGRVILYGYNTSMVGSSSFADLEALASSLHSALTQLLQSTGRAPLALIAHSLGGLLVKEAMIKISESKLGPELLQQIAAIMFFGVPHSGLDIESLIPMVDHQPNELLLRSIDRINSQILRFQERGFDKIMKMIPNLEVYCFYETMLSPTAKKDASGTYKMGGPLECLVTTQSATSCLRYGSSSEFAYAIPRTHSELVKFSYHDYEYDKVYYILKAMIETRFGFQISGPRMDSVKAMPRATDKLSILAAVCGLHDVTQTLQERIEDEASLTININEIDKLVHSAIYETLPTIFVKNLCLIYQYGNGPMRVCSVNYEKDSEESIKISATSEHTVVTARSWSCNDRDLITIVYGGKVFSRDTYLKRFEAQIVGNYKENEKGFPVVRFTNDILGEDPWHLVIKTGVIFFRTGENGPVRAAVAVEGRKCSLTYQPQLASFNPSRSRLEDFDDKIPKQVTLYRGVTSPRYSCTLEAGTLHVEPSDDPFLKFGNGVNFRFQSDCNFAIYRADGVCAWATNRFGPNAGRNMRFQEDGNLVTYTQGSHMWSTGTQGNPGARLVLSNTPPFVEVFRSDGVRLFNS